MESHALRLAAPALWGRGFLYVRPICEALCAGFCCAVLMFFLYYILFYENYGYFCNEIHCNLV